MRKAILSILITCVITTQASAQYQIKIKANHIKDSVAYFRGVVFDDKNFLAKDTVSLKNGLSTIKWKKPIVGGIYYLYFPVTKQKVYFVLENKDSIQFELNGENYLDSIVTNKAKNKIFIEYQLLERKLSNLDSLLAQEIAKGKRFNLAQKANFLKPKTTELIQFRTMQLKKLNSKDALYIHFDALNKLDSSVPTKKNYIARQQFFKGFNYKEPKLLFTPNLKQILTEYFSYYPLQSDSVMVAADSIMRNIYCDNKAFSYTFDYCLKLFKNRDIINNADGYAAFIKKYVQDKPCKMLDKKKMETLIAEISKVSAQKLYDTALNMVLKDTSDADQDMHAFAKEHQFTLIVFYDPNCEHCKVEVPKMDSVISVLEKQYVLNIGRYAICNAPTDNKTDWEQFISTHHLTHNYIHTTMGAVTGNLNIRNAYDAFSNPIFYLVDSNAKLIGKKISSSTIKKIILEHLQLVK